jgi:serine/threonine protein kinase
MHIGTRLGPYEILDAIGAGGMGEVFRACDTQLHRDVRIKVLPKDFVSDDGQSAQPISDHRSSCRHLEP